MVTQKALKSQTVSVPPRSSGSELHAAVAGVLTGDYDETRVMAASLEWTTPIELCGLRALIEIAAKHVDEVVFDCPMDNNVNNYLERMSLYEDMPANVRLSRDRPQLTTNFNEKLIELRRVDSTHSVEAIVDTVQRAAYYTLGRGRIAKACGTAVAAVAENVLDHAESPIGAFIAAQTYRGTGLELACVDLGLGIPTTLRRRPEFAQFDDATAVQKALEDGVTCAAEDNRGRGAGLADLYATVRRAGHSTLSIQSGRTSVSVGNSIAPQISTPRIAVVGTWISIRLQP